MKKRIIIHIGYPKTATTTLQKHLFSIHNEIGYIDNLDFSKQLRKAIYFQRELSFIKSIDLYKKELIILLNKYDSKKVIIYSNESLLSYSMFYSFEPYPNVRTIDPVTIARKIKYLFSNLDIEIEIMIAVRRQDTMIRSLYTQVYNQVFSKFKKTKTFDSFLEFAHQNKEDFIYDSLDYFNVINYYQNLFKHSKIKILIFEKLINEPEIFWKEMFEFLGVKTIDCDKNENTRNLGKNIYKTDDRKLNDLLLLYKQRYFPSFKLHKKFLFLNKLANISIKGKNINIHLSDEQKNIILTHFNNSNKALSKEYDLKLEKYNYYL